MKHWTLALVLGLAVLAGCTGGAKTTTEVKPTNADAAGFKVALLTPGPISDAGWSAMAYEGLKAIESELGAEINQQETKDIGIRDAMRSYAQKGYRLVIGHGFEYNEPSIEVAKAFPNTVFVSSSGAQTAANAGAFRFYLEQGFYLAGMMAAGMSKSGTIAMIGGPDVPSIRSTFKAFAAGAKAQRPDINVVEIFTGQNSDVAAAKRATETAIGRGADFVIHQANAAAGGVFEAAKEKGVRAIGANLNQNEDASGAVVASAFIVSRPAFVELARQVKDGTYKGNITLMGMDKGAIDFAIRPDFDSQIPADLREKLQQTMADIKSGKLVVPKDEF